MIAIDHKDKLVTVTVLGEFALADFQEFERLVYDEVPSGGPVNLLFDLREMVNFTVDMVLEEIKFSRGHQGEFSRIAVLTHSPWVAWTAWLEQVFVSADLRVFDDEAEARGWLTEVFE
ncbi:MAG: STAS/SEC14 domain-containing protein [Rhodocyclaceae bacterium]|nr:STAS/SEC14 domain-containing protein [Rhodocyclaceae bacterium]